MATENLAVPLQYPLLPLRDVVVFPHMVIPLFVGRPKSIKAMELAMEAGRSILLVGSGYSAATTACKAATQGSWGASRAVSTTSLRPIG